MVAIIGHRAFKGKYVENTLPAFDNAAQAGVDIIETDLQMTHDGVVVINHDSSTGRIWDKDLVIGETDWKELKKLRCKSDSTLRMMSLEFALKWSLEHPEINFILDIKFTNDKLILLKTMAAMLRVRGDLAYWQKRVIWGLWMPDWLEYAYETAVTTGFRVIIISLSIDVAMKCVQVADRFAQKERLIIDGVSLHHVALWTDKFQTVVFPELRKHKIKIFVWTVNRKIDFHYIQQLPVNGVITDDPIFAKQTLNASLPVLDTIRFQRPTWSQMDGIRVNAFVKIYEFVCMLLFAPWVHKQVFGWSIGYVIFALLKALHFL